MPGREAGLGGGGGEPVPGAHELAVVAAEDPVADGGTQLDRDRPRVLDREVGDAPARVELVRSHDRTGRADVDARPAAPAVVRRGAAGGQGEVGVELAEEEPRARPRVDEIGVLPDPAKARVAGEGPLENGGAVDECPVAEGTRVLPDAVREPLQPPPHEAVVVAPERVAGDVARRRIGERLGGRPRRAPRPVVHAHRDDAQRPRHEVGGPAALLAMPGHVAHLAVPSGREPVDEAGLVLGEVDRGDPRLAESELRGPLPDERRQGIEPGAPRRRARSLEVGVLVAGGRHRGRHGPRTEGDDSNETALRTDEAGGALPGAWASWTIAGPRPTAGWKPALPGSLAENPARPKR